MRTTPARRLLQRVVKVKDSEVRESAGVVGTESISNVAEIQELLQVTSFLSGFGALCCVSWLIVHELNSCTKAELYPNKSMCNLLTDSGSILLVAAFA